MSADLPAAARRVQPGTARPVYDRRRACDQPWRPALPVVFDERAPASPGDVDAGSADAGGTSRAPATATVERRERVWKATAAGPAAGAAADDTRSFWCAPPSRHFFRRPRTGFNYPEAEAALGEPVTTGEAFRAVLAQLGGQAPRRYGAAEALRTPGQPKRIAIFADGTWNAPDKREASGEPAPTNVWLLYQLVRQEATHEDGHRMPQLAFYHGGVGTSGWADRVLGGAFGRGMRRNILDCYRVLVTYYNPGDEILLFGFSRGAFTARSLAGLIRNCGIVRRDLVASAADAADAEAVRDGVTDPATRQRRRETAVDAALEARVQDAWTLYVDRSPTMSPTASKAVDFRARYAHDDVDIACIGVWDTVGALGIPDDGPLGRLYNPGDAFHDVRLSRRVRHAFHALAIDERRGPFEPTLWEQQGGDGASGQVLEQRWFPGVHSDVGGGYGRSERGLATVALRWMADRVCHYGLLDLDAELLARAEAGCPGRPTIHDSLSWGYRLPIMRPPRTRVIDGGLGQTGARDPGRLTTEDVDAATGWCTVFYPRIITPQPEDGASPGVVDVPHGAYAPSNFADYKGRLATEAARRRRTEGGGPGHAEAAPVAIAASDGPPMAAGAGGYRGGRLEVAASTTVLWVRADLRWNDTGIEVRPGEAYELVARGVWYDQDDACAADGYDVRWVRPPRGWQPRKRVQRWISRQVLAFADACTRHVAAAPSFGSTLLRPLSRRYPGARYFALVASAGRDPASFAAIVPDPRTEVPVDGGDGFSARLDAAEEDTRRVLRYDVPGAADGRVDGPARRLELFANDLPGFYGNNSGALAIVVTRVR